MNKLSKILTLINLFANRPMVSMKTIERVCDIPERTAYRYINDISDANFPVVYDKRLRAYRLYQRNKNSGAHFGPDEVVMLIAGLELLSNGLHSGYRDDVSVLVAKLLSCQEHPLEEILDTCVVQIKSVTRVNDFSEIVSSMFINLAIMDGRRVKLTCKGTRGRTKVTILDQLSLNFKNRWRLIGTNNDGRIEIPLDQIEKVTIIR